MFQYQPQYHYLPYFSHLHFVYLSVLLISEKLLNTIILVTVVFSVASYNIFLICSRIQIALYFVNTKDLPEKELLLFHFVFTVEGPGVNHTNLTTLY